MNKLTLMIESDKEIDKENLWNFINLWMNDNGHYNYGIADVTPHHVETMQELTQRFSDLARAYCPMEYQYNSRRVWANVLAFQNRITPDEVKLLEVYYGNLWTYVGD
jgi:hypothetical protein